MSNGLIIFFWLLFLFTFLIGPLLTYFFAKNIAKSFKRVKRIDNRKDLAKYPKLAEIVRIVKIISRHYSLPTPEVGIYPSREINAFATGRPNDSLIAISTGLIKKFNNEEIKGVLAHEASHLIHRDLKWILLIQGMFDLIVMVLGVLVFYLALTGGNRRQQEEESIGSWLLRLIFAVLIYHIVTTILRIITILLVCWFVRKRELKADQKGAKIVGYDTMITTLTKLLELEKREESLDDFLEEESSKEDELGFEESGRQVNDYQKEPNSISLLKFSTGKKKSDWLLELFRTHPPLEERIKRLKKLRQKSA